MKRNLRLKAMLWPVLTILTSMCLEARAQSPDYFGAVPPGNLPDTITPLQIGDTIPEYLWHLPLHVVNHPEGKETIMLKDYRGKLIILDFWSTWCSTCIAGMPKMFNISGDLTDNVAVIPVTYQESEAIIAFINRNPVLSQIPTFFSSVGDSILRSAFDISGLPNTGIIGPDGRVSAIVRPRYITADKLNLLLSDPKATVFPLTMNMEDITGRPLLIPAFGAANLERPVYYSTLMSQIPGLVAHNLFEADSAAGTVRYFIAHKQLLELYAMAIDTLDINFDRFPNRRILQYGIYDRLIPPLMRYEVKGIDRLKWEQQYLFNYEYIGPLGRSRDELNLALRHDLNRFFGLEARVEKRTVPCLVLQKISKAVYQSKDDSKDNRSIRSLIYVLNDKRFKLPPVLDGTDEAEWPRIDLPTGTVGPKAVNVILEVHGLTLVPDTREMDMLILGRPGFNPPESLTYTLSEYGYISHH